MCNADPVPTPTFTAVDRAYEAELQAEPDPRIAWLLRQTAATSASRRALLSSLGIGPGSQVLDVGTGFGCVPIELAVLGPVQAIGVDVDDQVLQAARRIADSVAAAGELAEGSTVELRRGDALDLPVDDASVDVATARFLYQYMADPEELTDELARVVRPGGLVCVVDVDDGLSITEPEPSPAFERLASAFRAAQQAAGGDRSIGRRLARILDAGGFDIAAVLVLPQAAYGPSLPGDLGRQLLLERFRLHRADMVATGAISEEQFDADLDEVAGEVVHGQCQIEAHLAVVGGRRVL